MDSFELELTALINKHSLENHTDSPDFILAEYMMRTLAAYTDAVTKRAVWHGLELSTDKPKQVAI